MWFTTAPASRKVPVRFGIVGPITLVFSAERRTKMDRLLRKKSKKSPKYSQRDIFPGILTNTAVGPLGFQVELNTAPRGERNRSHRDPDADCTDWTMAPDEENGGGSQIVFQGKTNEGQEPPAPEKSTTSAMGVGDADHGRGPSSECFRSLLPR